MQMCIKFKQALLGAFCCCLLTACLSEDESDSEAGSLKAGDTVPAFTVVMNDGEPLSSAELRGEVAVILFFNTRCKDCQQELPVIQRIYEDYGSRIRLVGISREDGLASVTNYWQAFGLTFPFSPQEGRDVYALFAQSRIPRVYLVDRTLTIRKVYADSPLATYEDLSADLDFLLSE
ncbi:antioxidant, AhpC/TSA family [gut metagenome]|uniref:Antioxidant, AhpC/TSA family n=1 Tax=gut metagenome TaxID=749906 RepID=J9G4B8_9ZZZZ